MNDGTMMINGKQLNKELLLPEFLDLFPEFRRDGWKISPGNYVCCAQNCDCYSQFFTITVRFQRKCLNQVRLYPEKTGSEKEAARRACDVWLEGRLGAPHEKNLDITMYEYEWGCVMTEFDSSLEPAYSIVIDYN